jgi:hypothetical protein
MVRGVTNRLLSILRETFKYYLAFSQVLFKAHAGSGIQDRNSRTPNIGLLYAPLKEEEEPSQPVSGKIV